MVVGMVVVRRRRLRGWLQRRRGMAMVVGAAVVRLRRLRGWLRMPVVVRSLLVRRGQTEVGRDARCS